MAAISLAGLVACGTGAAATSSGSGSGTSDAAMQAFASCMAENGVTPAGAGRERAARGGRRRGRRDPGVPGAAPSGRVAPVGGRGKPAHRRAPGGRGGRGRDARSSRRRRDRLGRRAEGVRPVRPGPADLVTRPGAGRADRRSPRVVPPRTSRAPHVPLAAITAGAQGPRHRDRRESVRHAPREARQVPARGDHRRGGAGVRGWAGPCPASPARRPRSPASRCR